MSQPNTNEDINPSGDPRYFNNTHCFNTDNSVNNVWNNCTIADQDSGILAWLSPLEPQTRHYDIRTRRVEKVGDWLLQTEEYRNWVDGTSSDGPNCPALFCHGGPEVGKTYISSLVIDSLCEKAVEGNTGVACFYFDFAVPEEQSPDAILGSVLRQVVGGLDEVPEKIVKAFRDRGKVIGGQRLQLKEIVGFLQDIASARHTFICMDALDEYPAKHRAKLLDLLNQILQKAPCARLFLTGRPNIRDEVDEHLTGRAVTRSITSTENDIITFLRAKLKEDTMPHAMDESLEEEIIQNLPKTVSEIFLLVFLGIKTILQEATIYRRRQRLREMESGLGLGGAYGAMLRRIEAQGGERARLGMAVLMWISHSRRPLQVDELCHAIAIRIGSDHLDNDEILPISTLLSYCQGLVTVDKGTSTVRLIHFSLQEYLGTHPDVFNKAHSTMAETCLTYLNFQSVKNLSADSLPNPRVTPFLKYSSLYWGTHMRMELSVLAETLAVELLGQWDSHIAAKSLWTLLSGEFGPGWGYKHPEPFPALHCISYFGIAEVADTLIQMNRWDVNQGDDAGMTPLIWAASCGHGKVVELLLQQEDIQPDMRDKNGGRTALLYAARNGHEEVVNLFLGPQFVNPGSIGWLWGTLQVVGKLFNRRYVNPDARDGSGRTPLSWAAENGHEGVVKLLLGRKDVNPDTPNPYSGRTPLSVAAWNGHEGIVKQLLARKEVNPDSSSKPGRTPLSWAAVRGHEGIVKLLLGRKEVNPDTPDTYYGQTPLSFAAENGHEGVVKQLLGRKEVNPDSSSKPGRTPLSWAAVRGHEGIVKLLLGRKEVNPDTPNPYSGQTPLSVAAENGHEGIVKQLLGRKGVNPDSSSKYGRTPLSWAAGNGHEGIVKLLLGRKEVNPDTPNPYSGRTPLSLAAGHGYEGIVKLLLGRKGVNPDSSNKSGRTPLSLAAGYGYEGIVKLLLGRKEVNPDTPDTYYGQTPLSWAAENGREGIVKLLLGRKGVNPDSSSKYGRTPLSWAAGNGHEGIVKLLLGRKDVSPDSLSKYGRTPLSWAAAQGQEGIVKLLLERKDINLNSVTKSGETPLTLATQNRHYRVAKLLQDRENPPPIP